MNRQTYRPTKRTFRRFRCMPIVFRASDDEAEPRRTVYEPKRNDIAAGLSTREERSHNSLTNRYHETYLRLLAILNLHNDYENKLAQQPRLSIHEYLCKQQHISKDQIRHLCKQHCRGVTIPGNWVKSDCIEALVKLL